MTVQMIHSDYGDGNTAHRHNGIFDNIAQNNAVHTAQNRIKCSNNCKNYAVKMRDIFGYNIERNVRLNDVPRNENFYKFTQTHKAIRQEAKATQ